MTIATDADLAKLRERLDTAHEHARSALRVLVEDPRLLMRLKFERLGCDPVDPGAPQNLAEQIDLQATYEAAYDALRELRARHPGKVWNFAPGAHGKGHDIASTDGTVAAEVFAAVNVDNNKKLKKDLERLRTSTHGRHRYLFFRSPAHEAKEWRDGEIIVVALPS